MPLLINPDELSEYCKRYPDTSSAEDLRPDYIGMAQEIIENYLGYKLEDRFSALDVSTGETVLSAPRTFRVVCMQIATLIYMTENSNIGYSSSSSEGGTGRVFLNVTDYSRYLAHLSAWREVPEEPEGADG